ncbi:MULTISPECIES: SDR family oxidoreductase [Bacillus cereus group]|uniref:NAD(P)-dependent oxidoreductase n=1 Tax=Bacillus cereus TaxID=1396 RepID=A0A2B1D4L5_BACCE|nr:SDR family oxidoreductase [Bacillus cereus]PDY81494.1 NAD(P)-dependent oxidoreductase [Bacillus cereus]PFA16110.1 NAD(P)-dependent oxidoreductase [Bacillus cereus]PFM33946.1 NAD(P)-dependent oxidoreductase [Bacillus cereus]PGL62263.1 NAD(P)-dependent oxidoreductase [Bacillus cereus]PGQ06726.1 NAD(P)-dependent oxidoreductase [Bacillus cereus]
MKVLVTGANGNLGSKIVEYLLTRLSIEEIIVGVRDDKSEKALRYKEQGLEVRVTDFENQETLFSAFKDVDRLFIMSTFGDFNTAIRQHTNAVEAAKATGVKQIIYPSVTRAEGNDFFLAGMHRAREVAIIESGIPYVILRNNWYVENELGTIQSCMAGAPWITSAGKGKIGWVYRPDLAEAAANILVADGHKNKIYELSGENLTQKQFVDTLSEVLGKEVPLLEVDDSSYEEMLKGAGVPEAYLSMLAMTQKGVREGGLESTHTDLDFLLKRQATPLKQALTHLLVNTR